MPLILKPRDTKILLAIGAVLLICVLIANHSPETATSNSSGHNVKYVVSGKDGFHASASLTYTNASGGSEQSEPDLPWSLEMRKASGSTLYLSAQDSDEYDSGIHVAIYVDGTLLQEASTTATYGIATASGVVH